MVIISVNIRKDLKEFIDNKTRGRNFNLSGFINHYLEEWKKKIENEKTINTT